MSSVATAKPEELEALARAEADPVASTLVGASGATRKGWLKQTYQHMGARGPCEISPQGRAVLADARALGWKPKQGALDL